MALDFDPRAILQEVEENTDRLLEEEKRKKLFEKVLASSLDLMPYLMMQQYYKGQLRKRGD